MTDTAAGRRRHCRRRKRGRAATAAREEPALPSPPVAAADPPLPTLSTPPPAPPPPPSPEINSPPAKKTRLRRNKVELLRDHEEENELILSPLSVPAMPASATLHVTTPPSTPTTSDPPTCMATSLWDGVSASHLQATPTPLTLPESPLHVASTTACAAMAAHATLRATPVVPLLSALPAPSPAPELTKRTLTFPAPAPAVPVASPSASLPLNVAPSAACTAPSAASPPSAALPSPPPPRTLHQEGWDLCMTCRKHYHHKMYYHCRFFNFK
jgi:hypothetical protein